MKLTWKCGWHNFICFFNFFFLTIISFILMISEQLKCMKEDNMRAHLFDSCKTCRLIWSGTVWFVDGDSPTNCTSGNEDSGCSTKPRPRPTGFKSFLCFWVGQANHPQTVDIFVRRQRHHIHSFMRKKPCWHKVVGSNIFYFIFRWIS